MEEAEHGAGSGAVVEVRDGGEATAALPWVKGFPVAAEDFVEDPAFAVAVLLPLSRIPELVILVKEGRWKSRHF